MKPNHENYAQWRERVLDPISPTFCGAKWGNATIWLDSGETASCHHPLAHKIDPEAAKANHKAIHNTPQKKAARADMLAGIQTSECDYCWRTENLDKTLVSDRTFKSVIYTDRELQQFATKYGATEDVTPLYLEIAFSALCNQGCSYCSKRYSTTWGEDIMSHGSYENLTTPGHQVFLKQPDDVLIGKEVSNPYVEAFWKWWNEPGGLSSTLLELRVTGGEALMSPSFWKLLDWYRDNPGMGPKLAVNSNMGCAPQLLERLIDRSQAIAELDIYTSCESYGQQAEYVRDGMSWDRWTHNVDEMVARGHVQSTHCMMTLSALSAFGVVEFMDWLLTKRVAHENKYFLQTSFNILRFPGFQSIFTLSQSLREELANELAEWLSTTSSLLVNEFEVASIQRYIEHLRSEPAPGFNLRAHQADLFNFLEQFDKRRKKDWRTTFPRLVKELG